MGADPGGALRALIVDDEPLARAALRELLRGQRAVALVGEAANGFEAVKLIDELRPDLVLLDVQMPKLDGFEVLELVTHKPVVIFVTAYDQYALRAFEVHAVDYLLKPCSPERLGDALERAREHAARGDAPPARELAAAARPEGRFLERIVVRDRAQVHVIPVERLDYVTAEDDYVSLRAGGKSYLKQQTLGELERALDPQRFVRIHRSVLLNVERLARIEPGAKDSRTAVLTDGTRLPVSRSGYARLRDELGLA